MSTETTVLKVGERQEVGKQARKLRQENLLPAVIYNHGKSTNLSADYRDFIKVWHKSGKHAPVELDISGKKQLAIIKEVDFEPVKHTIRHVVFGAIRQDEAVETEVSIKIIGEIPAEKSGLIIISQLESVNIKALPKNLPDELNVDGGKLVEIGDKITIEDIEIPHGVEVIADGTIPIAVVDQPRAMAAEEEASEEESAETESSEEGSSENGGKPEDSEEKPDKDQV